MPAGLSVWTLVAFYIIEVMECCLGWKKLFLRFGFFHIELRARYISDRKKVMEEEEAERTISGSELNPQAVVVVKPKRFNIKAVDHCILSHFTNQYPSGV